MNDPDRGHPATDRCSHRGPGSENSGTGVLTAALDLDALAAVAEAATPGPWDMEWTGGSDVDLAHIAAFDPPTVLALLAEARGAQRLRREVAALADALTTEIDELLADLPPQGPSRVAHIYRTVGLSDARDRLRALIGGGR